MTPIIVSSPCLQATIFDDFLSRYQPPTREGYGFSLAKWAQWCDQHGLDVLKVQRADIERWARHLEARGLMPSTVRSRLNAVLGLYKFAVIDGHLRVDPGLHVRKPRTEFVSTTNGLTVGQLAGILDAAAADGPQTHSLICLLALNGLRVGECLATNIEDLGTDDGIATLHLPHRKGAKQSTVALAERTRDALTASLAGRTSGPLLLGRNGERIHVASARRTIRRLCRACNITKRITPHSFRHSFITLALDLQLSPRTIMRASGHHDPKMLGYYDRARGDMATDATHAVAAAITGPVTSMTLTTSPTLLTGPCAIPGCPERQRSSALCERHLQRFEDWLTGQGIPPSRRRPIAAVPVPISAPLPPKVCTEPGCDRLQRSSGLCRTHYQAAYRARTLSTACH